MMELSSPTFLQVFQRLIEQNPSGLSFKDIAATLKIDDSTLWRYCKGEIFPAWTVVLALAYIFRLSPQDVARLESLYQRDSQDRRKATTAHRIVVPRRPYGRKPV